jgi:hypothetical protein
MKDPTKQLAAGLNARIETMVFGVLSSANNTPGSPCSVVQEFEAVVKKFAEQPKPVVGFVCRPDLVGRLRSVVEAEAHPLFGAVPVYAKEGEVSCKAFTCHAELRLYLEGNSGIQHLYPTCVVPVK